MKGHLSEVEPQSVPLYRESKTDHFVEVYDDTRVLAASVARFLSIGIEKGESAVLIADMANRSAIESQLYLTIDLASATDQGLYFSIDAREMLSRFMRGGMPDGSGFESALGTVISGLRGHRVRAFGEMVAVLWAEGNVAGALALEDVWNDFLARNPLSLYCAYPSSAFGTINHAPLLAVCERHSHVLVPH